MDEARMDRLLWMTCFTRAVETGSFSAVARELAMGQPNVSRHVAALETHLGVRLLHRSTRRLSLTPEGERYYSEARQALDAIAEAEANARGEDAPQGLLRVACPSALARYKLLPLIGAFMARYPAIALDLQIADHRVDLIEEGVDVAIRVGELRDSTLCARRLGCAKRLCTAAPVYLEAHGTPRVPADLAAHQCIRYRWQATGDTWPFLAGPVNVTGRLRVDAPEAVRMAVLDGLGIAMTASWLLEDALAEGRVQAVLADWPLSALPIHALYPAKRLLPRRAAVFMDHVAEAFRNDRSLAD
jgi:LysR family transcriptional regulator, regulator for bpeEF and oprC